jgi:hypothetical protein
LQLGEAVELGRVGVVVCAIPRRLRHAEDRRERSSLRHGIEEDDERLEGESLLLQVEHGFESFPVPGVVETGAAAQCGMGEQAEGLE